MLFVDKIPTGALEENCYLIYNDEVLLVVDPGDEAEKLMKAIDDTKKKPLAILLTHTHYDHIGAVEPLRKHYNIPVYVHEKEQSWLQDPEKNLSGLWRHNDIEDIIVQPAECEWEFKNYDLGGIQFRVVPTPGHSWGSVSLIFDNFVVCGDALFKDSVGRSDLPTGNYDELLDGIKQYLFVLPDEYQVYPGHGPTTTIGREQACNPHFNA